MPFSQDLIHKLEEGAPPALPADRTGGAGCVGIIGGYNWRAYRNLAPRGHGPGATARNLARERLQDALHSPFSMYLVKRVNEKAGRGAGAAAFGLRANPCMHPDISNRRFTAAVAAVLKVQPFDFKVLDKSTSYRLSSPLLSERNAVLRTARGVFFLTRRLFDSTVAWFSTIILFANELLWRFSVSGCHHARDLIFAGCCGVCPDESGAPNRNWDRGRSSALRRWPGARGGGLPDAISSVGSLYR